MFCSLSLSDALPVGIVGIAAALIVKLRSAFLEASLGSKYRERRSSQQVRRILIAFLKHFRVGVYSVHAWDERRSFYAKHAESTARCP